MDALYILGGFHGAIVTLTALIVLYSDHEGFNYFRGKKLTLSHRFLTWSHRLVWVGLVLIITTGVFLTIPQWEYRLQEPIFYVKMGFVLTLLVNAIAIGGLMSAATSTPFGQLAAEQKKNLLVSGALSALGWLGAVVIGLFFL